MSLCYVVYSDNSEFNGDNSLSPYYANIIKADGGSPIANLACDELGEYSQDIDNTSLKFFEGKKDVGTYTYTVNFDWINEDDKTYTLSFVGKDSMEVTVPVMYSESEGLYYLGEAEHYISMSNYIDFTVAAGDTNKLNPYVSTDPSDLNSWHFKYSSSSDGKTYFDDPNYVIASFAEYYKIVELFCNEHDMFNQYPSDSYNTTNIHFL